MKTHRTTPQTLGIDIGRVIISAEGASTGRSDTSFLTGSEEAALETPPSLGAFEAIRLLTDHFGSEHVFLVSKCGARIQARTLRWLAHQKFYEATGVLPAHVRFCKERREKATHCLEIGATHFIDDRIDVLEHLRAFVPNLYLFGPQQRPTPPGMRAVSDWAAVLAQLELDPSSSRMNEGGTCSMSHTPLSER